jgi:formylglycine-generating enzyme required for sulfatase activity
MIRSVATGLALAAALFVLPARVHAEPAIDLAFIEIRAAGDSIVIGDGMLGPNTPETITYDYLMSKFAITNAEFKAFMDDGGYGEPSFWTVNGWAWKGKVDRSAFISARGFSEPDQPVVGVSWYEAVAFCNWLSLKEGLGPAYDGSGRADLGATGYHLPTETEWEYAGAKGAPGQAERIFPWGDAWDVKNTVCSVTPSRTKTTAAVGSKSPQGDTPQGLADMSGNVWQWCSDNAQRDDAFNAPPSADRYFFQGDPPSASMMLRGGSWCNDFPNGFRVAFRGFTTRPTNRANVIGFRVVRRVAPPPEAAPAP